ncbi:MAG: hypothetical protein NTY11_01700, partial [Candidatus Parcubacteria bacterium]|nr:hypothetical protein [Candidatus Parcubacteria bacterium]
MKNQKNLFLLLLLLISFLISGNNISAAELLGGIKYTPNCIPLNEADPETGCRVCGDIGDNSITIAYEQCRQSYFVKQQTELVGLQQIPQ